MRREYFLPEAIFVNHDLKINIDIFATCEIVGFFLLLFFFHKFHLLSPFLSFLLDLFNLVHGVTFSSLHIEFYYNSKMITVELNLLLKKFIKMR